MKMVVVMVAQLAGQWVVWMVARMVLQRVECSAILSAENWGAYSAARWDFHSAVRKVGSKAGSSVV